MARSAADGVTTCSICGQPLNAKGDCLACLVRTALEGSTTESGRDALVFGDFEVVRREDGCFYELGHGGMGVTYLALDNVLRRKVALKVIELPKAARTSDAVRERFLREARAAASLRHPNVASVFQFGTSADGRYCYYAMELIDGETLQERVQRAGPLNAKIALEIAIQTVRALTAATAQGLIHRDLKPGNIMLTRGDADTAEVEVKVIDFGLAKAIAHAGSEMDLTRGAFVGTPNFASPEQFESGPVDVRADVYSLGATLWFALTGQTASAGRTIEEIRSAQKSKTLPLEQLQAAHVPSRLQSLLKSMLAFEPAARPGIQELAAALRRCSAKEIALEIAHVLFIDIVGYSKLSINEQQASVDDLTEIVRSTEQFQKAEAADSLIKIATGDGMALVFYTSPEAPVRCAIEISRAVNQHSSIQIRSGIHSGPVSGVVDVTGRANLTGAGINMAQRVMDCGDAGHILLSKRVAEDLGEFEQWCPYLHDLGKVQVKHGAQVDLVNFYNDSIGNQAVPGKIREAQKGEKRARHLRMVAIGVVLLVGLGFGMWMWQRKHAVTSAETATSVPEKSIAVLPFENLSAEKENAYFAGGVQDEILSNLAKVADLKVISRTSVMKYDAGPERNLREIAKTLGVSYVVEGSVQRAGGRVRVTAQLIDARKDSHVWAEHYDRDFADILAIQSEIAQQIADQLRARLSPAEKAAINEQPTTDLAAYAYYTRARELERSENWQGDEINLRQKVELLEKATERDPKFAFAFCELAKTHVDLSSMVAEPEIHEQLELAKQAAQAALRLRPESGEAHLEMARYYFYAAVDSSDYTRARDELAIVRGKLPNNAEALTLDARIGRHENRWDESLANLQKAHELDPRNGDIRLRLFQICSEMRLYREAKRFLAKAVADGSADNLAVQGHLADLKLAEGDPAAAQSFLDQLPLDYSVGPWVWEVRFRAALYLRNYDGAVQVIAATPAKWADMAFGGRGSTWAEGQIARARSDKQKANEAFATARKRLETVIPERTRDATSLSEIATLDAGIGKKEDAIREARRAVELLPIARDAVNGPNNVTNLALVYAWTGEREQALEQLEIVAKVPNGPTYGDLRFNPCWDSLRGDSRFEKIVGSIAPKDRNSQ